MMQHFYYELKKVHHYIAQNSSVNMICVKIRKGLSLTSAAFTWVLPTIKPTELDYANNKHGEWISLNNGAIFGGTKQQHQLHTNFAAPCISHPYTVIRNSKPEQCKKLPSTVQLINQGHSLLTRVLSFWRTS